MPFDINNLNPPRRFFYPQSDYREWVEFRLPDADTLRRIDAETTRERVEYHHPSRSNGKPDLRRPPQRVTWTEITDQDKRDEMMADASIVDWHLVTPDGSEIPCTAANKLLLMRGSADFALWANDCLETVAGEKGEQEKNS